MQKKAKGRLTVNPGLEITSLDRAIMSRKILKFSVLSLSLSLPPQPHLSHCFYKTGSHYVTLAVLELTM